jgi:hypothetical protein
MVRAQVSEGGDGLQPWRAAANVPYKQLGTADMAWSSSLQACKHFKEEKALARIRKAKNSRDLYGEINGIKKGYQPTNNLVKDENGDLLTDPYTISNRWKNFFSQLLRMPSASDLRQTEVHMAETLVSDPSPSGWKLLFPSRKGKTDRFQQS